MKRYIASWILLAAFLPMVVLSSLHIHETTQTTDTECAACVHHHCGGHMTQYDGQMHQCVLCQFLTLSMLAAATVVVLFINKYGEQAFASFICRYTPRVYGVVSLRAPPFV
ncbi:MAG: hypothetical protein IK003_04420 [Prevotella sp.]|nr:hypothetical protein [Prevotella sp.]